MKLLKWKDAYSVGEDKIDEQHKGLFKLSNEIYNLVEAGVDKAEIFRELFIALNDYTVEHFIYEEMYMQSEDYPKLKEHIEEHNEFSQKLRKIALGINKDSHIRDIGEFVTTWLLQHVLDEDMKYKKFVDSK
ncbi:Hemerythrin-like iron-binding protein [hydrothermal vent metagenome]|uniref:Hemerythrin-like iron-binding protein n=1 Tax=hydrothermal vent metagenome TaxID=652676 RepID=A0A1W1CWC2_9ZZZZ